MNQKPRCPDCKLDKYTSYWRQKITKHGEKEEYRCSYCGRCFVPKPEKEKRIFLALEKRHSKKPSKRDWSLYNAAQENEKLIVYGIIDRAVNFLKIPYCYKGNGRPHHDVRDVLKILCIKIYGNYSSRRLHSELEIAKAMGYISIVPSTSTISHYMKRESIAPYLHDLYKVLSLPFKEVEEHFVADSTGFSVLVKVRWMNARLDKIERRDFKKLHIMAGAKSQIITSARVTKGYEADSPLFEKLARETSQRFALKAISADSGYLSRHNCRVANSLGATPFIMPTSYTKKFRINVRRYDAAWKEMVEFFRDNEPLFREYYHKRSTIESAFSSMKKKFTAFLKCRDFESQTNELLARVCVHNACVLCRTLFEMGIKVEFKD